MKPIVAISSIAVFALAAVAACAVMMLPTQTTPQTSKAKDIYAFKMENIEGKEQPLSAYKGKVILAVNVASKCGLTPQYEGLEKLYQKYKDKGFVILGFPANEFGNQEPGTNAEIAEFCSAKYNVTFPMFSKIVVKGEKAHPLYQWLLASTENHNDIEWNFAKFLVDQNGQVVARFDPRTTPEDPKITSAIEKALAQ